METTPISNLFNLPSTVAGQESGAGGALGRDQFLQLLTAQLRYQDPLNPIENQEFTSQLAQFSSLEQMQQVNDTLDAELLLNQSVHNAMATTMIGRQVRVLGHGFAIEEGDETPPRLLAQPAAPGTATVTVTDAAGTVVRTFSVELEGGSEPEEIVWDGRDAEGDPLAPGRYDFGVTTPGDDGTAQAALTFVEDEVSTLRFQGGVTQLLLATVPYTLADVTEIRAHDGAHGG